MGMMGAREAAISMFASDKKLKWTCSDTLNENFPKTCHAAPELWLYRNVQFLFTTKRLFHSSAFKTMSAFDGSKEIEEKYLQQPTKPGVLSRDLVVEVDTNCFAELPPPSNPGEVCTQKRPQNYNFQSSNC
jgi:hypothetical protein